MKRTFRVLLFLAAFFLAAGAAGYGVLQILFRTADRVVVPDLSGRDVVWTLETLSALGLNTKVTGRVDDDRVPENHVLSQDPDPGREIRKGRDVRILLSAGTRMQALPDLVFSSLADARVALENADLAPGRLGHVRAPSPEGTVLAQFPPPGSQVARGALADLLVSAGPAPAAFAMPDLTGMDLDRAVLALDQAGLILGGTETARDLSVPENVVVDQSPGFGYRVAAGSRVTLTVNRPREAAAAPRESPRRFLVVRTPPGFLNTLIRLSAVISGQPMDLRDEAVPPGSGTWLLVPPSANNTGRLHRDGRPVDLNQGWADRLLARALENKAPMPEVPVPAWDEPKGEGDETGAPPAP